MRFALVSLAVLFGTLGSYACAAGVPKKAAQTKVQSIKSEQSVTLEKIATGLDSPWGLTFLPGGDAIVTEINGAMRIIKNGKPSDPVQGVPKVAVGGQGGLLDVQAAPDFAKSKRIYFSFSEPRGDNTNGTSVASATLARDVAGARLENVKVIFQQKPAKKSALHFGGRIIPMPDGSLFITLGERAMFLDEAQSPQNELGKLVRITPDGSPHAGNPKLDGWAPKVWSIGHRNMQGAAINPKDGKLWTVEHGAKGGDEINIPKVGHNYGWPIISYGRHYSGETIGEGTSKDGMEQPVYYWDPSIAPSSLIFYTGDKYPGWKGDMFVGALAGQALHRLKVEGDYVVGEEILFRDKNFRFRNVVQGPDGYLYVLVDSPAPWGSLWRIKPTN
jgi:glucose/arabinose dehydrogenase